DPGQAMGFAALYPSYGAGGDRPIDSYPVLLTMILVGLYSAQPRPLRGASRGVVEAGRTEGEAGEQALLLWWSALGEIPGLGRCGARGRASQARTRAASGLRPGALRPPARSWLTAAGLGRKPNRLRSKARPDAGRKTPRWSAERRAGQRHWPAIPGDPGIGPTARRATGCGVPHQRLSALCPPRFSGREKGTTAYPAPQRMRAATLAFIRRCQN